MAEGMRRAVINWLIVAHTSDGIWIENFARATRRTAARESMGDGDVAANISKVVLVSFEDVGCRL